MPPIALPESTVDIGVPARRRRHGQRRPVLLISATHAASGLGRRAGATAGQMTADAVLHRPSVDSDRGRHGKNA
ncbi:MAG TPA: hypothetical protein VGH01_09040 [Jatrophihabitantaceae bacterium]|jgi:hypothetical protein